MYSSGNSLVVQWLGLHTSIRGGMSSISGQGTKILFPHSVANKKRKKISRFSLIISQILSLGDRDYCSKVMSRRVSHWNPSLISDHCEPQSCQIPDTCPSQINVKVNLDDCLCKGLSMVPGTIASTQYILLRLYKYELYLRNTADSVPDHHDKATNASHMNVLVSQCT